MNFYAILIVDGRSTLFGPFDSDAQRETSIAFHLFDYPAASALRLDVDEGNVSLREHQSIYFVPQHHPEIVLFDPRK